MREFRALGALLITAPSEHERLYEIAVRLARSEVRPMPHYELLPWVRVRANTETGAVLLAAGIKVKRIDS